MIIVSKYLVPKDYLGLTIFPFVFLKEKDMRLNKALINHEKIHLRQQLELLVLPFYVLYVVEFLIRYMRLKDWKMAYRSISFEREAYINESDLKFLKKRSFWNFIHYF